MMASSRAIVVSKSKWQNIAASIVFQSIAQCLHNYHLALHWRLGFPYRISHGKQPIFAKQRTHMLLKKVIANAHVHPVVVEEEKAIAAPILYYG